MTKCSACRNEIDEDRGAPHLCFLNIKLCLECSATIIVSIFALGGQGDGGLIAGIFQECVRLNFNLKKKKKDISISKLEERIAYYFPSEDLEFDKHIGMGNKKTARKSKSQ